MTNPTVTGSSPSCGFAAGGNLVTITGTGFSSVSQVRFGGVFATFSTDSDTKITAVAPPGTPNATPYFVNVVCIPPGGGIGAQASSANNSAATFTWMYPYSSTVTVTGVSPDTVSSTSGASGFTVTGTGFTSGCKLCLGGQILSGPTVVSDTEITFNAPAINFYNTQTTSGFCKGVDVQVLDANGAISPPNGNDLLVYPATP